MQTGAKEFMSIPETHNAFVYLMEGHLKVNGNKVLDALNLVNFALDGSGFELEALSDARFLLERESRLMSPLQHMAPLS